MKTTITLELTDQELAIINMALSNRYIDDATGRATKVYTGTPAGNLAERVMDINMERNGRL